MVIAGTGGVDLDPMRTHLRTDDSIRRLGHDGVGLLNRHVTVDALVRDLRPKLFLHATTLDAMAVETPRCIGCWRPLRRVHIVTGRARHIRGALIAAAAFEQAYLVRMYVRVQIAAFRLHLQVAVQRLSGPVSKCLGNCRLPHAVMA